MLMLPEPFFECANLTLVEKYDAKLSSIRL